MHVYVTENPYRKSAKKRTLRTLPIQQPRPLVLFFFFFLLLLLLNSPYLLTLITEPQHRNGSQPGQQSQRPGHILPPEPILNKPTPKRAYKEPQKLCHGLYAERLRHRTFLAEDPWSLALHVLEDSLGFDVEGGHAQVHEEANEGEEGDEEDDVGGYVGFNESEADEGDREEDEAS